jgi:hypothetical protein
MLDVKEVFDMKVTCKREGEKISQKVEQDKRPDATEFVYRVFYSPKLNSCVEAQYTWDHTSSTGLYLRLADVLNQKEVWSASYHQNFGDQKPSIYPDAGTELDRQIQVFGLE